MALYYILQVFLLFSQGSGLLLPQSAVPVPEARQSPIGRYEFVSIQGACALPQWRSTSATGVYMSTNDGDNASSDGNSSLQLYQDVEKDNLTVKRPGLLRRIFNWIFRRQERRRDRFMSAVEQKQSTSKRDFVKLVNRIQTGLNDRSEKIVNDIAVDFCKLIIQDSWEIVSFTDGNVAKAMSSNSTVAQISSVLLDLSTPDVSQNKTTQDTSQPYIFQWRQAYNTIGGYPIQSHHAMLLGDTVVIEFDGRILFDLSKRQILFQMDSLKVLNVTVDLDSVMVNATKASER